MNVGEILLNKICAVRLAALKNRKGNSESWAVLPESFSKKFKSIYHLDK